MPKAVEIDDFAAKLGLVCKRLNWSRAKLAQQTGIDKSLAGRWLSGTSRPTGNSLMRLNAAVTKDLPDFTAATWDLERATLAAHLKVVVEVPPMASPALSGAAVFRMRALGRHAQDIDAVAPIFCGFYRAWFRSFLDKRVVLCRRARIFRQGDEMRFENDGTTLNFSGPCFVANRRLYVMLESQLGDGIAMGIFGGPYTTRVRRLTGLIIADLQGIAGGAIGSAPAVAEFIAPMSGDAKADAAFWESLAGERRDLKESQQRREVPKDILRVLRAGTDLLAGPIP